MCEQMRPQADYTTFNKKGEPIGYCRACRKERNALYNKGRERDLELRRRQEKIRRDALKDSEGFKERFRESQMWSKYRLHAVDYDQLAIAAGGICQICLKSGVKLVIDHDHAQKRFRGLICNECNSGIGMLREDPVIFAAALEYLARHKQPDL